jgi:hypothetical protein
MFEAIKNLKPAHRLQAFLFVVILSTVTSIATAYMSTDDCSGLAGQYNVLIKNYTETMSLNNQLVADNNQKQKDFMLIKKMLDSLNNIEPEIMKKVTIKNDNVNPIVLDKNSNEYTISDTVMVSTASAKMVTRTNTNKTIKTETTVTKISDKHQNILDKVMDVLKKHEKQ